MTDIFDIQIDIAGKIAAALEAELTSVEKEHIERKPTANELIDAIKNISDIFEKYKVKIIEIRDFFNRFNDGNSSERLLRFLKLI